MANLNLTPSGLWFTAMTAGVTPTPATGPSSEAQIPERKPAITNYVMDAESGSFRTEGAPAELKHKKVSMASLTADVVADAIIAFCGGHGDLVTNLRLQKLLYYAQSWFLALHDKPLFTDPIVASDHGPLLPAVFGRFAVFGNGPILRTLGTWVFPRALSNHIDELMEVYGRFSAYDLERLSCDEEPWKSARRSLENGGSGTISNDAMKHFYRLRINASQK